MLPASKYPANAFDGNEQTQPLLPEGGTDVANASDYNKLSTEAVAHGDDLRSANVAGGQTNHTAVHTDQEVRIAALESAGGGGVSGVGYVSGRYYTVRGTRAQAAYGTTGSSVLKGRLGAAPMFLHEALTVDKISAWLLGAFTTGTNGNIRLGVWADTTFGGASVPGALLIDSGEIVISLGSFEINVFDVDITNVVLPEGPIWIGSLHDDVSPLEVNTRGVGTPNAPDDGQVDLGHGLANILVTSPGVQGAFVGVVDGSDTARRTNVSLPNPFPTAALLFSTNGPENTEGRIALPMLVSA